MAEVESYQQYLWGILFPSPRIVQNEQLDIILLTQKVWVIFFIFGMKAFVRRSQRAPPAKHKNQFLVEMLFGY